jgi:2-iminobutanoate/2-iminopropanoate deaminase
LEDDVTYEIFAPKTVHPTKGYSHAVRMGDLVFVSGQVSQDTAGTIVAKGDVRGQAEQVFANLKAVLEAAGSGLDRIGKITVFTVKPEYRPAIAEVREKAFAQIGHYPASTYVVVSQLAVPDWLVEVEAIAMVK